MMRLFSSKRSLPFLWLLAAICYLPAAEMSASGGVSNETRQPAAEASVIVARIGDYAITRGELEKRLMTELYPYGYEAPNEEAEPPDANTVLMTMVGEKAMVTEARRQGYLEDETTQASIKRFKERRLVNLLLQRHLQGKITVTDNEIEQKMQADPKLDKAQAQAAVKNAKANEMLSQYYSQVYKKSHVEKLSESFPRVVQIHQRLLYRPKQPRTGNFIRTSQVNDELTPEEKNIVLAKYDHGQVTLKDWFDTLCGFSPPSRPKDLNTAEGVERLLERALRMPLLVSEAELVGLDKDEDLLKQVREHEDRSLLSKAKLTKHEEVKEPTTEQIIAYFGKNKEAFGTSKRLKIDLIWCQDLNTAKKAKAELDAGEDFESVRQKYSLEKKGKPFFTHPSSEGLFWKDLWAGDPNEIIGPVKGFYRQGIKWRIVKILEKHPGEVKEYSDDMQQRIKNRLLSEQRETLVAQYVKELLRKYPYQIYADKIKDIDPLNIP